MILWSSELDAAEAASCRDGARATLPEHVDIVALLESARQELATFRPEEYKILLLGAMAGLRRNEIDVLPWSAFRWNEGVIRIETTEFYRPKSHNSEGDVRVDPNPRRSFAVSSRGAKEFVIESDRRRPLLTPLTAFIAAMAHAGATRMASFQRRQLKDAVALGCEKNSEV